MKRTMILAVCAAIGGSMATPADARDGCGEGWFFNGVACAPMERGYRPVPGYGPPPAYYAPRPQFVPEPHYYGPGPRGGGGGGGGDMYRGRDGQLHCRNPKFTVQDGQCKPYSGR